MLSIFYYIYLHNAIQKNPFFIVQNDTFYQDFLPTTVSIVTAMMINAPITIC